MGGKRNAETQFYGAVVHGDLKKVRHLVFNEGVSVNYKFVNGSMPLHVAAERGLVEVTTFLLSMKASMAEQNSISRVGMDFSLRASSY